MRGPKGLVLLLAAVAVVLWLALRLASAPSGAELTGGELLLPGLAEQVNEIAALEIIDAADGSSTFIYRDGDGNSERWRLREAEGYEADFSRIHELLAGLARARLLEPRSDRPEHHARLGVAAPVAGENSRGGSTEGSGVLLRFPGTRPGMELDGLIVGKPDPTGMGNYVRREGETQVWLADALPPLPASRHEWLERAIMDIPAADMAAVDFHPADGDPVRLRPADEEGRLWVVLDLPDDRQAAPEWILREAADGLARLNLEWVRRHEEALLPESYSQARFQTRDGLVFSLRLFRDDLGAWVHFRVEAAADQRESLAEDLTMNLQLDAMAVDGRLSPWQFALRDEDFDRLDARSETLTQPLQVAPGD